MAEVKIKGLDKLEIKLKKQVNKGMRRLLRSKAARETVAQTAKDEIRKNVFGVAAASTQETRARLEETNKTHPSYNRAAINVTFTGEQIDDLRANLLTGSNALGYKIEHGSGKHKQYKNSKGKNIGKKIEYRTLQKHLKTKGYDYTILTADNRRKIGSKLKKVVDKLFKNYF